ncbi:MAG: sigma-70 family RNA polymerase sigma factor [Rubrivivax sp.]
MDELAALLRQQRRRLVAHLAHGLGLAHLSLAEDAVQVACLRALETWPTDGRPAHPAGWLYRVARHHAIDQLRRGGREVDWPDDEALPADRPELQAAAPPGRLSGELDDEELALLFAACHPRLPPATQVALGLRTLAGLELGVIAEALFSTEAALAQRLARARAQLAGQALAVPAGHELAPRLEAVRTALLLMFHTGPRARAEAGDDPAAALVPCWEAIRLARALAAHRATAGPASDALAALLLLHGARLSGRLDEAGDIVPLPGQPRDRWDAGLIRLGLAHLQAAQRGTQLTRWHAMAGIAAEHAVAARYDDTDWPAIVRWYEHLLALDPSAAPRLGHAVALAEGGSAAQALQQLLALRPAVPSGLQAHTLAALARAHERLGDTGAALHWLDQAIAAARPGADARLLQRRRDTLAAGGPDRGLAR